eukprot:2958834-Pleurochrysis_carterae.AAC.7
MHHDLRANGTSRACTTLSAGVARRTVSQASKDSHAHENLDTYVWVSKHASLGEMLETSPCLPDDTLKLSCTCYWRTRARACQHRGWDVLSFRCAFLRKSTCACGLHAYAGSRAHEGVGAKAIKTAGTSCKFGVARKCELRPPCDLRACVS